MIAAALRLARRLIASLPAERLPLMALLALLLGPWAPAHAGVYQLYANTLVNTTSFFPLPGDVDAHALQLDYYNQPQARSLQRLDDEAHVGGGSAQANFLGQIGMLKAYASASYPYCCPGGEFVLNGYANASVTSGFYDTISVWGAGLAIGTPVSYTVTMRINGTLSYPDFESGGYLSGYGQALVRLTDMTTRVEAWDRWYAHQDEPGLYSVTLNTEVGREISISGTLDVGASVSAYGRSGRWVESDFYHSVFYSLLPSVEGLNTLGSSGHDFALVQEPGPTGVPEPASLSMVLLALGLLGWLRTQRVPAAPPVLTA